MQNTEYRICVKITSSVTENSLFWSTHIHQVVKILDWAHTFTSEVLSRLNWKMCKHFHPYYIIICRRLLERSYIISQISIPLFKLYVCACTCGISGFWTPTSLFTLVVLCITVFICLSYTCFGHFKYLSPHNYEVSVCLRMHILSVTCCPPRWALTLFVCFCRWKRRMRMQQREWKKTPRYCICSTTNSTARIKIRRIQARPDLKLTRLNFAVRPDCLRWAVLGLTHQSRRPSSYV